MIRRLVVIGALALLPACAAPDRELKITDRRLGAGDAAVSGASVTVHYTGWLWKNGARGKQFDSSRSGKPFTFKLGSGVCKTPVPIRKQQ